ncbi:MAG: hypothetical protein DRJ03_12365 [Chloroflexi bacterium]|nr:MAG: hypothetical protein DRJ03_12365 [Chloroflexota bacterium]
MAVFKIMFNIRHKAAFLDNRKHKCPKHKMLFIDVFEHCFRCENFAGLIFSKTGLKIYCVDSKKQNYFKKAVNYLPRDFKSLLKLHKKVIKSKNKEKTLKFMRKHYRRYEKWNLQRKTVIISC